MARTTPARVTKVLVVDDHPVFRKGLVEVLGDTPDVAICCEAGTVSEALAAVVSYEPDVAIVDLSLGDESGLGLVSVLSAEHPAVHVLVLSGHDERVHADRALKAGALGYVMKDKAAAELVEAVRRVADGKTYVSQETADRLLTAMGQTARKSDRSPLERLSDRERQVLTLMGRGHSTREIAARLTVSVKTVESHCAHIKQKLGLSHGRELMRAAVTWVQHDRL